MSIISIIGIIITILKFIMGLFNPTPAAYMVAMADYDCGKVEWVGSPAVTNGVFVGTAQVHCEFEGTGAGNIRTLKAYMVTKLPKDGDIQGEAKVAEYQGLPSLAFRTHLSMSNATVFGMTNIASDNVYTLRNIFESDSIQATDTGKYLKSMFAETHVSAYGGGEYGLRIIQTIQVQKPSGISSSYFQSSLMDQAEESLMDRAVDAVHEMASHLD